MIILQRVGLVRTALAVVLGLSLSLTLTGCGGGEDDGYEGVRGSVEGKTSYADKPLPKGTIISFETFEGTGGTGVVDGEGNYEIIASGGGLPIGKYMVSVSPPDQGATEPDLPSTLEEVAAAEKANDPANVVVETEQAALDTAIPAKYQMADTSGLEFEVKEGKNTFDIELTDE